MKETKVIEVSARSGGVGVTTLSSVLALTISRQGKNVALVDTSEFGECFSVLAMLMPNSGGYISDNNLTVYYCQSGSNLPTEEELSKYDVVVVDVGFSAGLGAMFRYETRTVSVVRNAYTSLKAEVRSMVKPDVTFLFKIPTNALNESDCSSVLGTPLTVVDVTDAMSRTIDAGLLPSRPQHYEWAEELSESLLAGCHLSQ